jgi:hypothetical protein
MDIIQFAIDNNRMDLAAHVLILAALQVLNEEKENAAKKENPSQSPPAPRGYPVLQ